MGRQVDPDVYPEYGWNPRVLERVKASSKVLARAIEKENGVVTRIKRILRHDVGITDFSQDELARLTAKGAKVADIVADMVARRAGIGFTTHGHTAVDVNLYTYRGGGFKGNHENVDVSEYIQEYLGITGEMNELRAGGS